MQIYRFSLIFHSISELNKEKLPDFTKNFTDVGRRIGKSRNKLLFTLPFACIGNCAEIMNFIMRTHPLHFTTSSTSLSWHIRLRWLKETNAVAEGDECDSWRRRMQWPKETNAVAEGDECCGWRRRLRRINKTLNATFSDVSLVFKLKFHSSTITILQYITFPSIRTIIINRTFMELSTIVEIIEAY